MTLELIRFGAAKTPFYGDRGFVPRPGDAAGMRFGKNKRIVFAGFQASAGVISMEKLPTDKHMQLFFRLWRDCGFSSQLKSLLDL